MEFSWSEAIMLALVFISGTVIGIRHNVKQLADRVDAINVQRAEFDMRREAHIRGLESKLSGIESTLKDLSDFQKGKGIYWKCDPDPLPPESSDGHPWQKK